MQLNKINNGNNKSYNIYIDKYDSLLNFNKSNIDTNFEIPKIFLINIDDNLVCIKSLYTYVDNV